MKGTLWLILFISPSFKKRQSSLLTKRGLILYFKCRYDGKSMWYKAKMSSEAPLQMPLAWPTSFPTVVVSSAWPTKDVMQVLLERAFSFILIACCIPLTSRTVDPKTMGCWGIYFGACRLQSRKESKLYSVRPAFNKWDTFPLSLPWTVYAASWE